MSARGRVSVYRRGGLLDREAHTKPATLARSPLQAYETMQARLP